MTKTFEQVVELLKQPLDTSRVKYREAPGSDPVPYIEGQDAINTANEIFDFRWSSRVQGIQIERWERVATKWNQSTRTKDVVTDKQGNPLMEPVGLVYATVEVEAAIGQEVYTKSDVGVSTINGPSPESLDTAIKGAVTDAMKRCFRQFGEQFGNSLYDKEVRVKVWAERGEEAMAEIQAAKRGQRSGNQNGGNRAPAGNGNRAAQSSAPAAKQETKPAATQAAAQQPTDGNKLTVDPEILKTVIPQGAPLAGKTFGEAIKDSFGLSVVTWLQGGIESAKSRKVFTPANVDDERVAENAKKLIAALPKKA